jgi:hypothetical protein
MFPSAASAMQDPFKTLDELVEETPVIVVGQIDTYRLKEPSVIGGVRFSWDADLTIARVLIG